MLHRPFGDGSKKRKQSQFRQGCVQLFGYVRHQCPDRFFPDAQLSDSDLLELPQYERNLEGLKSQYNILGYEEVENIVVKCDERTAGWVAGKSWFPGQRMEKQANGEYYFYFARAAKPELIWFIMQNGGHLELLEPAELRGEIFGRAELLCRQHRNRG